jgi:hypothetical protein
MINIGIAIRVKDVGSDKDRVINAIAAETFRRSLCTMEYLSSL